MHKDMIIGRYSNGNNVVITYWDVDTNQYVTALKDKNLTGDKPIIAGIYGKDHEQAAREHKAWVGIFRTNEEDSARRTSIKITYTTLMKILYQYIGNGTIEIFSTDNPNELKIQMLDGQHPGACTYNTSTMEASAISDRWYTYIEETKAQVADDKMDAENPSECLC